MTFPDHIATAIIDELREFRGTIVLKKFTAKEFIMGPKDEKSFIKAFHKYAENEWYYDENPSIYSNELGEQTVAIWAILHDKLKVCHYCTLETFLDDTEIKIEFDKYNF